MITGSESLQVLPHNAECEDADTPILQKQGGVVQALRRRVLKSFLWLEIQVLVLVFRACGLGIRVQSAALWALGFGVWQQVLGCGVRVCTLGLAFWGQGSRLQGFGLGV